MHEDSRTADLWKSSAKSWESGVLIRIRRFIIDGKDAVVAWCCKRSNNHSIRLKTQGKEGYVDVTNKEVEVSRHSGLAC